jgi:hypothetical protein
MQSVTQVLNQLSNPPAVTASLVRPPRLGLAITVDNQGTSGSGLEFMYDHPDYDSRLEVDTPHGVCLLPCSP